jgi:hypothetical protein
MHLQPEAGAHAEIEKNAPCSSNHLAYAESDSDGNVSVGADAGDELGEVRSEVGAGASDARHRHSVDPRRGTPVPGFNALEREIKGQQHGAHVVIWVECCIFLDDSLGSDAWNECHVMCVQGSGTISPPKPLSPKMRF